VCGRREEKLREAKAAQLRLHTRACDLADPSDRVALAQSIPRDFPALDILVNNAGIQRRVPLTADEPWADTHEEIALNLEAPIHLATLFASHLLTRARAAIVNVTSGLAFAPR